MLRNLTPHRIVLRCENGQDHVIPAPPKDLELPRVQTFTSESRDGHLRLPEGHIPRVVRSFGAVQNLPDPQPGITLIVSALVMQAAPTRWDLAAPGDTVRNSDGVPVACRSLVVAE